MERARIQEIVKQLAVASAALDRVLGEVRTHATTAEESDAGNMLASALLDVRAVAELLQK